MNDSSSGRVIFLFTEQVKFLYDLIFDFSKVYDPMKLLDIVRLLKGKLRRQFLVHFRLSGFNSAFTGRQGECLQCANCCRFVFRCPFLSVAGRCVIYNTKFRPKVCIHFPLGRSDLEDVRIASGRTCGYRFSDRID